MLTLVALTGCEKHSGSSQASPLCGEWRGYDLSADAGIYICFTADGTFELYQKLASETFELRRGTWTLAGDILSGKYNDEEPWAASYKAVINGDTLTLTSQKEGEETNIYRKCEIPEHIKESSTVIVKSGVL